MKISLDSGFRIPLHGATERLINKVLQTVFARSGQTEANFRRKRKLSDEKLDKDRRK